MRFAAFARARRAHRAAQGPRGEQRRTRTSSDVGEELDALESKPDGDWAPKDDMQRGRLIDEYGRLSRQEAEGDVNGHEDED